MKKLILASNNAKKVKEIKEILEGLPIEVKSLKDEGIDIDVVEDGKTFEENAKKKAKEIYEFLLSKGKKDFIVLADDSGLEGNDDKNNEKLLENLEGVPKEKRGAQFVCQLSLFTDKGEYYTVRGEVRGFIIESIQGKGGFGYDPLFFYEPFNKTFGELEAEEKNKISHRGIALIKLKDTLIDLI